MLLKSVIVALVGTLIISLCMPDAKLAKAAEANRMLRLAGKRAVVVGGTSGIGHGIALRLAEAGCSVTIVGRSQDRGDAIVQEMKASAPADSVAAFDFSQCDCFSLAAVKSCSEKLLSEGPLSGDAALDYLVESQGMATLQGFTPTADGLDQKLTLHVFSRAAFALHLLPSLRRSEDGRMLSVLSAGVHASYGGWGTDPELKGGAYGLKSSADSAGFYNDIIVDSLSRENEDVTFMHAAPGFVKTRWGTEMPAVVRFLVRGLQTLGRSQEACAEYMVHGLTAPEHKGGFQLLDQFGKIRNYLSNARTWHSHHAALVRRRLSQSLAVGRRASLATP